MDTNLGTATLDDNQIKNFGYMVKPNPFKGFCIKSDGSVIGVSDTTPTDQEKTDALSDIQNIPTALVNEYYADKFSTDVMLKRFGEDFTGSVAVDLAPYLSAIKSYTDARNFSGLKVFMSDLVTASKMTAQQETDSKAIILEQGVDLADY